jgi:phosphomannomutase
MAEIKFGTDGWRAIIAQEYTVENVARVAEATAQWLLQTKQTSGVVIGHDNRFGGRLFARTTAAILCSHGIKVFFARGFVSSPMVSLGILREKADLGIVITASHNPPSYNGFKLKGSYGGPLLADKIAEIEPLIKEKAPLNFEKLELDDFEEEGLLVYLELETLYCNYVEANFDLDVIRNSKLNFVYDAMYGAGQNVIPRLLPNVAVLHCDNNPSFHGQAPEPIHKNLEEFCSIIKVCGDFASGLATDGDADRIGLYDGQGNFIDSNHIILLLIKYLYEHKGLRGKVVTTFSVTPKVAKLCEHYGIEHQVTRIGFKYVADYMLSEDVLLGGEESGGIAIKGHIPERDGIWIGLTIWEYMAVTGKSLQELIKEIYAIVGPFASDRSDLHLEENVKNEIVRKCEQNLYSSFGGFKIKRIEVLDGYKYFFENGDWLMIRASGTEPVLRNYAESSSTQSTQEILRAAEETLLNRTTTFIQSKPGRPSDYARYLEVYAEREDQKDPEI